MAIAGMPVRWHSANRSFSRAAPSSIEYSVCTCRCTTESSPPAAWWGRARGEPGPAAGSRAGPVLTTLSRGPRMRLAAAPVWSGPFSNPAADLRLAALVPSRKWRLPILGPSAPGALNVTSAQTYGATCGPSFATSIDSHCTAPPGFNARNVAAADITASPNGPIPVADQPAAGAGTAYSAIPGLPAVVVTWDDSDGWYDHVLGPLVPQSQPSLDALPGP